MAQLGRAEEIGAADRLLLLDPGGRLVTGKDGAPVAVPFDMPGVAPPQMSPLGGTTAQPF